MSSSSESDSYSEYSLPSAYRDSDSNYDQFRESIYTLPEQSNRSVFFDSIFSSPALPNKEQRRDAFRQALLEQYNDYIDKFYELKDLSDLILARINNEDPKTGSTLDNALTDQDKNRLVNYYTNMLKDISKYEDLLQNFNEMDDITLKHRGAYRLASKFIKNEVPSTAEINKAFEFLKSKSLSPQERRIRQQLVGGKKSAKKSYKRKPKKSAKKSKRSTKKASKRSTKKRSTKGKRKSKKQSKSRKR